MSRIRYAFKIIGLSSCLLFAAVIATFAGALLWPQANARTPSEIGAIAFTNVTIVDIKSGALRRNQTVVVRGNRIESVGLADQLRAPAAARIVDGTGQYLMPSLWDMHTHVYAVSPMLDMPLYIAYGVTNVRDLQGCPAKGDPFIACYEDKQQWTQEALSGKRVSPRIIEASSFMANGPGMAARLGNVPAYFDLATPEQARQFVRHFKNKADSIKVYDKIPRDSYFALADEARKQGLTVVGHKPRAVSAIEAAANQKSIEHARFALHESFDGADALRHKAATTDWMEDRRAMVDRNDPQLARAIFESMKSNGTYYVPTHLTRWSDAYADMPQVRNDPALVYLHPLMKMQWIEDVNATLAKDPSPEARKAYVDFYKKGLELTKLANDVGVKIMVGTDYIAAGFDVHRELEQLVAAGLTPQEALVAATVTPAEYAGLSDLYGEISPGRAADLIMLGADPLLDVRNTQQINAVVFNGSLYDSVAIAELRERVKKNAKSWSVGAKILWRFIKNPANY